jgi:hypothetical protein
MLPTGFVHLLQLKHYSTSTKQVILRTTLPLVGASSSGYRILSLSRSSLKEKLSPGRTWVGPTCQDAEVYLDGATRGVVLDQDAVSEACGIHDLTAIPQGRNQLSDVEVASSMARAEFLIPKPLPAPPGFITRDLKPLCPLGLASSSSLKSR